MCRFEEDSLCGTKRDSPEPGLHEEMGCFGLTDEFAMSDEEHRAKRVASSSSSSNSSNSCAWVAERFPLRATLHNKRVQFQEKAVIIRFAENDEEEEDQSAASTPQLHCSGECTKAKSASCSGNEMSGMGVAGTSGFAASSSSSSPPQTTATTTMLPSSSSEEEATSMLLMQAAKQIAEVATTSSSSSLQYRCGCKQQPRHDEEMQDVLSEEDSNNSNMSDAMNNDGRRQVDGGVLLSPLSPPCSRFAQLSFTTTVVPTKETDGPRMDALAFDKLVICFLEKRTVKTAQDVLKMFENHSFSTFQALSRKCATVCEHLQEHGRMGLLPSAVKLTSVMVPHVKNLQALCDQATDAALERDLSSAGFDSCLLSEMAMSLRTEGVVWGQ